MASTSAFAAPPPPVPRPPGTVRLMLTGDVMLGRGVDQVLPHHVPPVLYEGAVRDARTYVELAVEANGPLPGHRGVDYPWGFALQEMDAMAPDARIINLETALTTHDSPWPQKGINYRCHPANVGALTAAHVDIAVLSNNHVLDWREPGLLETLATLKGAGVRTAGAGVDAGEARTPAAVAVERPRAAAVAASAAGVAAGREGTAGAYGVRGAAPAGAHAQAAAAQPPPTRAAAAAGSGDDPPPRVLVWGVGSPSAGVFEEWAAGPRRPGVWLAESLGPATVAEVAAAVGAAKRPGIDIAVVSIHWGSNWGFAVPQEQMRFARALIDEAGVDLVHGHSSHHARGFEVYKGRLILYGAGDLISDYEGIRNYMVEASYPHASHRDDVGLLWWADVDPSAGGALAQLTMTPTRLRHLRLEPPDPADVAYIEATMDREARRLGLPGGVRALRPGGGGGGAGNGGGASGGGGGWPRLAAVLGGGGAEVGGG